MMSEKNRKWQIGNLTNGINYENYIDYMNLPLSLSLSLLLPFSLYLFPCLSPIHKHCLSQAGSHLLILYLPCYVSLSLSVSRTPLLSLPYGVSTHMFGGAMFFGAIALLATHSLLFASVNYQRLKCYRKAMYMLN